MINVTGDGIMLLLGNVGVLAFFGNRYVNKVDAQSETSIQIVATLVSIQENLKKDNERAEKNNARLEKMFREIFERVKELEEVKTIHNLFMEKSECPMFNGPKRKEG